jgi:3-methyladenine DNA glycosylase AlkC
MGAPLKDLYSPSFYAGFGQVLKKTLPAFDEKEFIDRIFTPEFPNYELKERMAHSARVLHHFMPAQFDQASTILIRLVDELWKAGLEKQGLEFMLLPEYVSLFGLDHFESAVAAMETITRFSSCEFAVRPFIIKYGDRMLGQMLAWSKHPDERVRRLSSEGSRPRLPWAIALPSLKADPAPILPILENLKKDPSESVRRSVANSLNDIAKDNPEVVIEIARRWKGLSKETDAILKHGARTLLKRGNKAALAFFQLDTNGFRVSNFEIKNPRIRIGETLEFQFSVANISGQKTTLRLEYAVYFRVGNGGLSKKVFKISEREFAPHEEATITKRHSFRVITTRKYYLGEHRLSIITNGREHAAETFELCEG